MMGYGAGLGFGVGGLLALLGCALLVVGVVVLVMWAVGRSGQVAPVAIGQAPGRSAADAIEVLRQRFARGEITADEFTAAKQVLEADR
jgi:putative membrane protein